jgi:hypothetical protein
MPRPPFTSPPSPFERDPPPPPTPACARPTAALHTATASTEGLVRSAFEASQRMRATCGARGLVSISAEVSKLEV